MDNIEIDFDKLLKYSEELVDYEDVLPLLIRAVIMKQWTRNLNKKGKLPLIREQCITTKPRNYTEAVQELKEWCSKNKEYEDIILK